MKITIIGAGGVRTPLIVQAILKRQAKLGVSELALMDIDAERLELIGALTSVIEHAPGIKFAVTRTTDPIAALSHADFVITTFRVGGIESRVIDEQVPLSYGILGQETTGPGGCAMALRSIPVLLEYVQLMQQHCPDAWLINFANPAGMITEAVIRNCSWSRIVGICDGPASMQELICAVLEADPTDVYIDYFGLNHLGWIKGVQFKNKDHLPQLINLVKSIGYVPGLPFDADLISSLDMIPNEYLYYYYYNHLAVKYIQAAGESRGQQVARENLKLFADLKDKFSAQDLEGMQAVYRSYQESRSSSYMVKETGKTHDLSIFGQAAQEVIASEGYAGVALNLIEALIGDKPSVQILNIANMGAISGLQDQDVVEVPALVRKDTILPLAVNNPPQHGMGLIKQVKDYEHWTIDAAVEKSYQKARMALAIHPLVRDYLLAKSILDDYIRLHKGYFPALA
jgi:6-phospho-beta-glucosidase